MLRIRKNTFLYMKHQKHSNQQQQIIIVQPVSYTHLDVYKRQSVLFMISVLYNIWNFHRIFFHSITYIRTFTEFHVKSVQRRSKSRPQRLQEALLDCPVFIKQSLPLDVYKRQMHSFSHENRNDILIDLYQI